MPSGSSESAVAPRHTTTQRRLLTVFAGVGVAVLTGVAFVLSYDDLRALALAGRAATRYAPAYPIMYDALIVVTILSLLVARGARWWTRWTRWLLLLVLLNGAAAASVQRAIQGYDSLPDQALVAGVAAAPHLMLVIAVWLWLAMFRQARSALARRAAKPRLRPVAKVAEELPAAPAAAYRDRDLVPGMRPALESAEYGEVMPARLADTEPSVRILGEGDGPDPAPVPGLPAFAEPHFPEPTHPEHAEWPAGTSGGYAGPDGAEPDHGSDSPAAAVETTPPPLFPAAPPSSSPPSDVRLVARPPVVRAATTRPDIVLPDTLDPAEDDVDDPAIERAEDPDAGDGEPAGDMARHRPEPAPEDGFDTPDDAFEDVFERALGDTTDAAEDDLERWHGTAAHDPRRWADDEEVADDLSAGDRGLPTPQPDVEWPPSSTFRSSPTPPTG